MSNQPNLKNIGPLLTTREAAAVLGISVETLRWWRRHGGTSGPDFMKVGDGVKAQVRYPRRELIRWIDSRMVRIGKGRR